jgi:accessory colonization factor AcfC
MQWNLADGLLKRQVNISGYIKEGDGCKLQSECDIYVETVEESYKRKTVRKLRKNTTISAHKSKEY